MKLNLEAMTPPPEGLLPPPRPRSRVISLRLGYQTLLKGFALERLYEEEKREGVIQRPGPLLGPSGPRLGYCAYLVHRNSLIPLPAALRMWPYISLRLLG